MFSVDSKKRVFMTQDKMRVLFSATEIEQRLNVIAKEITQLYSQDKANQAEYKKPIALCILKGAAFFFVDLLRKIDIDFEIEFMKVSSYGESQESSGCVQIKQEVNLDFAGRDVLLVEDIVDSGHCMKFLIEELTRRGAKSIKIVALVDKYERRESEVKVDFAGFTIEKGFIVGCGMDFAEKYRALPDIYEIIT